MGVRTFAFSTELNVETFAAAMLSRGYKLRIVGANPIASTIMFEAEHTEIPESGAQAPTFSVRQDDAGRKTQFISWDGGNTVHHFSNLNEC